MTQREPERRESDTESIEEKEVEAQRGHSEEAEVRQPPPVEPAPGGLFARLYSLFRRPRGRR
jgi:hypothetical protein